MDKVFVATEQDQESSCVYAYFAFELISIGVCKRDEGRSLDATKKVLEDRKSTRLNSSHIPLSRMPSSA